MRFIFSGNWTSCLTKSQWKAYPPCGCENEGNQSTHTEETADPHKGERKTESFSDFVLWVLNPSRSFNRIHVVKPKGPFWIFIIKFHFLLRLIRIDFCH